MSLRRMRGEIWQVDMGIAGKVRPCLLLTDYPANDELALVTVIPHTTALRGNEWERVGSCDTKAIFEGGCFSHSAGAIDQPAKAHAAAWVSDE